MPALMHFLRNTGFFNESVNPEISTVSKFKLGDTY
jgi:hypothetical protein